MGVKHETPGPSLGLNLKGVVMATAIRTELSDVHELRVWSEASGKRCQTRARQIHIQRIVQTAAVCADIGHPESYSLDFLLNRHIKLMNDAVACLRRKQWLHLNRGGVPIHASLVGALETKILKNLRTYYGVVG